MRHAFNRDPSGRNIPVSCINLANPKVEIIELFVDKFP